MTNQAFPSLNDVEPSWADIAVTATIDGGALLDMEDIAAIKFTDKVELGMKKGTSGGRIMSRTQGEVSYDASITFYRGGLKRFKGALAAKAPPRGKQKRISLVGFDVLIQHTPFGSTDIFKNLLRGCRYVGSSDDMKEGNEADKVEATISVIEIVEIDADGNELILI